MRMVWNGRGAIESSLLRLGRLMGALKLHGEGVSLLVSDVLTIDYHGNEGG